MHREVVEGVHGKVRLPIARGARVKVIVDIHPSPTLALPFVVFLVSVTIHHLVLVSLAGLVVVQRLLLIGLITNTSL